MLRPFATRWKTLAPTWPIVLAADINDPLPPATNPGLPVVDSRWSEGGWETVESVIGCLVHASQLFPHQEWVIKLDVDILHLSLDWLITSLHAPHPGVGIATHGGGPAHWYGAVYAIHTEHLHPLLKAAQSTTGWRRAAARSEDQETHLLLRQIQTHQPHLHPASQIAGWQPSWTPQTLLDHLQPHPHLTTIHLGQHGGRLHAPQVLATYPWPYKSKLCLIS